MADSVRTGTGLSQEEALARARSLVPLLRAQSAEAENLRRISVPMVQRLHDEGLFRILQPRRYGGSELPLGTLVEVCALIARGCASTAWVYANLASHHWMLGMWGERAQTEIWGDTPDALIASAFVFPAGHAYRADGGYRISGRWKFSSGVESCGWTMVGAIVHDEAGDEGEYRMFILPRADYRQIDTWFAVGLRGTGSSDVEIRDAFVPEHRTLAVADVLGAATPGSAVNPGPLYRVAPFDMFPYVVGGVALGIAEGAIDAFVADTVPRLATYSSTRMADYATVQVRLAEASAATHAARLVMLARCDEAMRIAARGRPSLEDKVAFRRDGAYAARLCTRAVDLLFEASGADALYDQRAMQRAFRDVHAANNHSALTWDVAASLYGKVALGIRIDNPTI